MCVCMFAVHFASILTGSSDPLDDSLTVLGGWNQLALWGFSNNMETNGGSVGGHLTNTSTLVLIHTSMRTVDTVLSQTINGVGHCKAFFDKSLTLN